MRTRPSLPRRGSTPASEWDAAGLRGRHSSVALLALIGVGLALLLWQAAASGNLAGLVPGAGAAAGPAQEACEAAGMTWLPEVGLCTHGPDPAPPGVDPTRRVSPIGEFSEAGLAPSPLAVCDGDGVSGKRVQVLYVHASDVPSQFNRYLASFRQWSADTSQIYTNSARETGGNRYIRYVHDANCVIDVRSVTVAPAEDDSFGAMASAASRQGHNRADRKYLMYADITDPYACGVGSSPPDDRPGADNESNLRAGYTVVYAGCWANGTTAAHELGHNLGAVQLSAPNSSGGGHCTDEWDVMCYSDSPNFPAMRFRCTARDSSLSLDCNKDDYYHTNPGAGSYLATHWNVANSAFLGRTAGPATTRPANDDFANATAIGAVPYTSRIDTANATTAADDPIDTREFYCGSFLSRTVWYRFMAPATATYEFDTAGSDYRLVLDAFTGSRGSLVQADCDTTDVDDLNRPVRQPVIGKTLTAGSTLYLAVGAHFSPRGGAQTPGGNLVLNVTSYTNQDPEVVFVAPTEGATVSGVVPIRVRATDDRDAPGRLRVFYEDDTTSEFTFLEYNAATGTYDGSWDARAVATGARNLTAWVNDSAHCGWLGQHHRHGGPPWPRHHGAVGRDQRAGGRGHDCQRGDGGRHRVRRRRRDPGRLPLLPGQLLRMVRRHRHRQPRHHGALLRGLERPAGRWPLHAAGPGARRGRQRRYLESRHRLRRQHPAHDRPLPHPGQVQRHRHRPALRLPGQRPGDAALGPRHDPRHGHRGRGRPGDGPLPRAGRGLRQPHRRGEGPRRPGGDGGLPRHPAARPGSHLRTVRDGGAGRPLRVRGSGTGRGPLLRHRRAHLQGPADPDDGVHGPGGRVGHDPGADAAGGAPGGGAGGRGQPQRGGQLPRHRGRRQRHREAGARRHGDGGPAAARRADAGADADRGGTDRCYPNADRAAGTTGRAACRAHRGGGADGGAGPGRRADAGAAAGGARGLGRGGNRLEGV